MKAVVVSSPGTVDVTSVPDPRPEPDEVVIAVAASGICGTDLQIVRGGFHATLPLIPGHEFAGTVVDVGSNVTTLRVGDRVAADPNIPCLHCRYCHDGRVNLCVNYAAVGVTRSGAAAEYVAVPHHLCVVLPEALDLADAALIEPMSCAVHAVDLLGPQAGRSVGIYGSGTMGLMMLQLMADVGVASVDLVDPVEFKLVAARELGASRAATSAAEIVPDGGWDVVIDATGVPAAIEEGITKVARGGTFLQFGVSAPEATVAISPFRVYADELRIIGAVCPLHSFERSAGMLAAGVVSAETLISDRVPLGDYASAIDLFATGRTRKVLVLP